MNPINIYWAMNPDELGHHYRNRYAPAPNRFRPFHGNYHSQIPTFESHQQRYDEDVDYTWRDWEGCQHPPQFPYQNSNQERFERPRPIHVQLEAPGPFRNSFPADRPHVRPNYPSNHNRFALQYKIFGVFLWDSFIKCVTLILLTWPQLAIEFIFILQLSWLS